MASVIIGIVLTLTFPAADGQMPFGSTDWSVSQAEGKQNDDPSGTQESSQTDSSFATADIVSVNDGFVLINHEYRYSGNATAS